jgi:hypothetical protein
MRVWETSTRARVKLEQLVGPRRRRQQVVDWNGTDRLTRRSSTRNQQTPCTVKVHAPLWLCSQNLLINAAQCQTLFFVCLFAAPGISMHACQNTRGVSLCLEAPWADWVEARFRHSRRAGRFWSFGKEHARAKGAREQCAAPRARRRTTARRRVSWVPATPCAAPRALASLSLSFRTRPARCTVPPACMHPPPPPPCPHSDTVLNLQYIYYYYYMYCPSSNNPTWLQHGYAGQNMYNKIAHLLQWAGIWPDRMYVSMYVRDTVKE